MKKYNWITHRCKIQFWQVPFLPLFRRCLTCLKSQISHALPRTQQELHPNYISSESLQRNCAHEPQFCSRSPLILLGNPFHICGHLFISFIRTITMSSISHEEECCYIKEICVYWGYSEKVQSEVRLINYTQHLAQPAAVLHSSTWHWSLGLPTENKSEI